MLVPQSRHGTSISPTPLLIYPHLHGEGTEERVGFEQSGQVAFPGYAKPLGKPDFRIEALNPESPHRDWNHDDPLHAFVIWTWHHSRYVVEWPLPVSVASSLRGFRRSLDLSQARFAEQIGVPRVSIERWEAGKIRPFRGETLSLMALLRQHIADRASFGQFLNLAAAAVCPKMTRPTHVYTGHEISSFLTNGHEDLTAFAPALFESFTSAEILVVLDESEPVLDARYIPLVGVRSAGESMSPAERRLVRLARSMSAADLRLWRSIGARFADRSSEEVPKGEALSTPTSTSARPPHRRPHSSRH